MGARRSFAWHGGIRVIPLLSRPERNGTISQRRNPAMDELTEYLMSAAEDGFWDQIQSEVRREAEREPVLVSFLFASVLRHRKLEDALGVILANKLQTPDVPAILLCDLIQEALAGDVSIRAAIRADLLAARTRDPAAQSHAVLQGVSRAPGVPRRHWLWEHGLHTLAAYLQNRISEA